MLLIIFVLIWLLGGLKTTFSSYLLFLPTYFFFLLTFSSYLLFLSAILFLLLTFSWPYCHLYFLFSLLLFSVLPPPFSWPPPFAFFLYFVNLYSELFSLTNPTIHPPPFVSPLRFIVYALYYLLDTNPPYTLHSVPWATFNFTGGGFLIIFVFFRGGVFGLTLPSFLLLILRLQSLLFEALKISPLKNFFPSKSFYKFLLGPYFAIYFLALKYLVFISPGKSF